MKKRIIGIDFGLKRIGIAISDETHLIATPFQTFEARRKTDETVQGLVTLLESDAKSRGYEIETIVVGMPYLLSGKQGLLADETEYFVEKLKNHLYPVVIWDERLTTVQAERTLKEAKMNRKKRAKVVDRVAAVIILQNFLDHQRG